MSCEHAHQDGAYVLGALSPAERQEFEQHLATCPDCARSVRELAGLPGLLARVDPDILTTPPGADPVPETLLPALVDEVRRTQRRRTWVTAGTAAAAAVAVTVLSVTVANAVTDDPASTAEPSDTVAGQTMDPVGGAPVRASVAFEGVAWGTKLDLTCTYTPEDEDWEPRATTYALFVRTQDGQPEQVATWKALPGKTMQLLAATAASPEDIVAVQVRTTDGTPVLTLHG